VTLVKKLYPMRLLSLPRTLETSEMSVRGLDMFHTVMVLNLHPILVVSPFSLDLSIDSLDLFYYDKHT
jgi:hypothetical protein